MAASILGPLPELRARWRIVLAISNDERRFHLADHLLHLDGGQQVEPSLPPDASVTL